MVVKRYGEKHGQGGMFFNAILCLFATVYFFVTNTDGFQLPVGVFWYGIVNSVFYATGFYTGFLALSSGSFGLTRLMTSFSAVFPIFYGILVLQDPVSPLTVAGMVLVFVSVILMRYQKRREDEPAGYSVKWVISVAVTVLSNALIAIIGKMQHAGEEENWQAFLSVWPEIIRHAEEKGVTICIENCPMYFTKDEWPGGKNLASSPQFWKKMFDAIPSANFALNYDPSHFVIQQMDYIQPMYQFADRIKHFHIKDVRFYKEKYDQCGFMVPPLNYIAPKLPGLGDVNWGKVVSTLNDIGYRGDILIEVEDRAYEDTLEDRLDAIRLSKGYMEQFII